MADIRRADVWTVSRRSPPQPDYLGGVLAERRISPISAGPDPLPIRKVRQDGAPMGNATKATWCRDSNTDSDGGTLQRTSSSITSRLFLKFGLQLNRSDRGDQLAFELACSGTHAK